MLGRLGGISETTGREGVTRLGYTQLEREAHALFGGWAESLGLAVTTDAVGNTIAELPGREARPALGCGSHLDSVPCGGRFDGAAGVVAALEAVRIVSQSGLDRTYPIRVVAFACEEGVRFGEPCIGSKAVAGQLTDRDLGRVVDRDGTSLAAAMRVVQLDPGCVAEAQPGSPKTGRGS